MERYLETGEVTGEDMVQLIRDRKLFPCFFGSALKLQGVEELLDGLVRFAKTPAYGDRFGARVYKISRDSQGNRLTHLKVTGGCLRVRTSLEEGSEEKVNQIRIYSGSRFETVQEAGAGTICAVTGLSKTFAGQGLGAEAENRTPCWNRCWITGLSCQMAVSRQSFCPKLRQLEEEDPLLRILWNEPLQEITVQLMGQVQTEVLQSLVRERFGVEIGFGPGNIVYKETIAAPVEGVGDFRTAAPLCGGSSSYGAR